MAGDSSSAYIESIVAVRANLLTQEEQLAGEGMISLETQELGEDDFYIFCQEHFREWVQMIRSLSPEQQDLLLSYYMLGKTQEVLAKVFSSTQTVCSFRIRAAIKVAGGFLMWGGPPSEETLRRILLDCGYENKLSVSLTQVIQEYAACRSFAKIASRHNLHRPDVRRAMSRASKCLLNPDGQGTALEMNSPAGDPEGVAVGNYIFNLIDKVSPTEGKSKRLLARTSRVVVLREPAITGEFRVIANDPDFDALFVSRANR